MSNIHEYAVKFVIGVAPDRPEIVAPGYYWTAINLYNGDPCADARIWWRTARALPGLTEGAVSPWSAAALNAGRAAEIDCAEIDQALALAGEPRPPFPFGPMPYLHAKGFVIIRSDTPLEVVAVYTTVRGSGTPALHMERVVGTIQHSCTETVSFDTGTNWEIVAVPEGAVIPNPITVALIPAAWAPPPAGASWIGEGSNFEEGEWEFRRTFDLDCASAYAVEGTLQLRCDNSCRVSLNGVSITGPNLVAQSSFLSTQPALTVTLPPELLVVGTNTLDVVVQNDYKQVGLLVSGSVLIRGLAC